MNKNTDADIMYKEKLEDNFLSHIGYEHVENLCNELDLHKDQLNELEIPDHMDEWFKDFQRMEKKGKSKGSKSLKFARRAAVVILFIIGVNLFLITNVEAYRIQFFNTVISIQEQFTQIDYETNDNRYTPGVPENWSGYYYPTYIPIGYKLIESDVNYPLAYLKYTDDLGNRITLHQYLTKSSSLIDSESGNVTSIIINGEEAVLIEKGDDIKFINWVIDDMAFCIETNYIKLKEMIKMAESVKIYN